MSSTLLDAVRTRLAGSRADPTPARVAAALRAEGRLLGDTEVLGVVQDLRSELVGAGPLEPLLALPDVTDVLVTAPDQVWIDRGAGLERTEVRFADAAAVRRLAQRLAAVAGRRLDDAKPWLDARLPDGTRLHAVLPPVAVASTCLSLRVVRPRAFTLAELVAAGTVPPAGKRCSGRSWTPGFRTSSAAARDRGRRPCSAPCWAWWDRASASCWSRTPRSCGLTTPMSYGWRRAPPTRRAVAW